MHEAVSLRLALLAATCAGLVTLAAAQQRPPAETWTVGATCYERVRVLEVTPGTVMIAHAGGMVQIPLESLPADLQQRFHFDPEKAAAWAREAESGMAATEELKRRQAAETHRRAELEAVQARAAQRAAAARAEAAPALDQVVYQAEVDLRPTFIQHSLFLKNQGPRPSCSIFAVVSVLEYEYARRHGTNEQLSEEFLIWAFQRKFPGRPINDGYHFAELIDVLRTSGIARRSLLPDSFASYLRDENPPAPAIDDALTRRTFSIWSVQPGDEHLLAKLVHVLNKEVPVIIGVGWPAASTIERNNLLRDQVPVSRAGHAVTLVGYRSDGTPESVVFIFRNSYGPQWGLGGYGLMAGSYVKKHLLSAFCLFVPENAAAQ